MDNINFETTSNTTTQWIGEVEDTKTDGKVVKVGSPEFEDLFKTCMKIPKVNEDSTTKCQSAMISDSHAGNSWQITISINMNRGAIKE